MFSHTFGEAAVGEFFYSRFTFKLSFFFRLFPTCGSSVEAIMPRSAALPLATDLRIFWFLMELLLQLYPKSAILRLSFLDPKDLCLPNQFSRRSSQKRSVSTYLAWCQRRNWLASMIELTVIFNPSYICHDMNIFWPAHFWGEFSQSWKVLRKTLRSHENLWSLADLNGANIGFRSNSRHWLFWMFMMPKNQPINEQKHAVSAASGGLFANRTLLTELST